MTIAGELINILGFKLEGEQNLAKFNDGMDKAENKAKRFHGNVRALATAAGLTTTGLVALGTSAIRNFAGFDREMTRIGITADATAAQTAKAAEEVQRLATNFALPIQDAVGGLDTLVASGQSLEEAMAFLPSVLSTAQASGASVTDVANTALKAASALKLEASEMQRAFDVMVSGGKAGQFEMKDMASFIPTLANSFANLGYQGEDGLKRLIAILQTLREDTGTAGQAATQAQNIFSKMFSTETEKNFKGFGVDIRKEVDAAVKAGEGAVEAYVRISRRVMEENPTAKLVDLFADQEFQLGMQSLMTSGESFEKFLEVVNGAKVDGTVFRDLQKVTSDTQASIDNLSGSWDRFLKSLGGALSGPVGGALDAATGDLDRGSAIRKALEEQGKGYWERESAMFFMNPYGEESERLARQGGYVPRGDTAAQDAAKNAPYAYKVLGRRPNRPVSKAKEEPSWFNRFMYGDAAEEGFDFRAHNGIDVKAGDEGHLTGVDVKATGETPARAGKSSSYDRSSTTDATALLSSIESKLTAIDVGSDAPFSQIASRIENMNSTLAKMTSSASAEAVITDARTDARDQSVKVGGVSVVVNSVENASAAVGAKVGSAIGGAVGRAGGTRFEKDDQL